MGVGWNSCFSLDVLGIVKFRDVVSFLYFLKEGICGIRNFS